jgi:multidrug efflux pump subunit AcrB
VQGINPLATGGARIADVELNLHGPDLHRLQDYAERLMAGIREMSGMVDVDTTLAVRTPELRLEIDREKASDLGLNVQDVASTVQTFIAGLPVSKYKEGHDDARARDDPDRARPGPGAGSRSSIAKVIVGGQMLSLLITLLITPVAYSLFDDLAHIGWCARVRAVLARAVAQPLRSASRP